MKNKKQKAIITILVIAIIAAIFLTHIPKHIRETMTVATYNGETAILDVDILYFPNLILPSYAKGTLSLDGVSYTDEYTFLQNIPSVTDNRLFPSEWWKTKGSVPYNMIFIRTDCTDVVSAHINRINVLDVILDNGIGKIHLMYTDEVNQVDGVIKGISFWGPSKNAEEAKQIAELFGYKTS